MNVTLDNIKYLARDLYGFLPSAVCFATKKVELEFTGSNTFSSLYTFENPMFVTNVQISSPISTIGNSLYVCFSANDSECESAVNVGTDYDISVGSIWKYLKVAGSASGSVILTITGYELKYNFDVYVYSLTEYADVDAPNGSYKKGDVVHISAIETTKAKFLKWSDGNTEKERDLVIGNADIRLYAEFELLTPKIKGKLLDGYTTTTFSLNGYSKTIDADSDGNFCYEIPLSTTITSFNFQENKIVEKLIFENFDTTNVESFYQVFYNCINLKYIDVSCFNTENAYSIQGMFYNCTKLEKIVGLKNFDTAGITSMYNTFNGCYVLTGIEEDIKDWNTAENSDFERMFYNCRALVSLDLRNWDVSNAYYINYMFYGCSALVILDVSTWNTTNTSSTSDFASNVSTLTIKYNSSIWKSSIVTELSAINWVDIYDGVGLDDATTDNAIDDSNYLDN